MSTTTEPKTQTEAESAVTTFEDVERRIAELIEKLGQVLRTG